MFIRNLYRTSGNGWPVEKRRAAAFALMPLVAALATAFCAVSPAPSAAAEARPRAVSPRGERPAEERATIELFDRSKRAVVHISTSRRVVDFWTRNVLSIPRGTGSGFVWDDQGDIVTNYHVIAGAAEARPHDRPLPAACPRDRYFVAGGATAAPSIRCRFSASATKPDDFISSTNAAT